MWRIRLVRVSRLWGRIYLEPSYYGGSFSAFCRAHIALCAILSASDLVHTTSTHATDDTTFVSILDAHFQFSRWCTTTNSDSKELSWSSFPCLAVIAKSAWRSTTLFHEWDFFFSISKKYDFWCAECMFCCDFYVIGSEFWCCIWCFLCKVLALQKH